MRIQQLEIENFGVFRNRQLELNSGLQIIYGENESGKTTLLQLVRQLLFGFPHRNPYLLADHAGTLSAKANLVMKDGQRLWFRRRKGRPDQVTGEIENDGEITAVDEGLLTAVLGKATGELYNNVFAFSLQELANGTQSLRDANLTEALYGGGFGNLANVQNVRTRLESETKQLFNTRSPKSEIRRLLQQLEDNERHWREAQVSPTQHREMLTKQIEADQSVEALKKQLEEARQLAKRRRQLVDAKHTHDRWQTARQELALLPVVDLDEDAARRFEWLQTHSVKQKQAVNELKQRLQTCESQLSALPPDGAFSAEAKNIQLLHQQVAQLQGYREDLPRRRQEAESIRETLLAQLVQINPEWTVVSLPQLQAGEEQRSAVQRLSETRVRLDRKRAQAKSQLKELRLQAEHWRAFAKPTETNAKQAAEADKLAEQYSDYLVNRGKLHDVVQVEFDRVKRLTDEAGRQLSPMKGWKGEPLPNLPNVEVIETAQQDWDALASRHKSLSESIAAARTRKSAAQERLAAFQTQSDQISMKRLAESRERRDLIFDALRRHSEASDDLSRRQAQADWNALGMGHPLTWDAAKKAIAESDRSADALLESADLLAQSHQLQRDCQQADDEIQRLSDAEEQLRTETLQAKQSWGLAWETCGLAPSTPREMETWRQAYLRWSELRETLLRLKVQRRELQTQTENYEGKWIALLQNVDLENAFSADSEPVVDPESKATENPHVAQGLRWWKEHCERTQQCSVAARELPEIERRLQEANAGLQDAESDLEKWAGEWSKLLRQLDFPPHWEPQLVQRVHQSLTEATSRLKNCESLEKRAADMLRELQAAKSEVDGVLSRLDITLHNMPVDSMISHLYAKLEDERSGQQQKRILAAQHDDLKRRLDGALSELKECLDEHGHLKKRLDASDGSDLESRLQLIERRNQLQRASQQALEQLTGWSEMAGLDNVEAYLDLLQGSREVDLRQDVADDQIRLKELEDELEQAQRKAGAAVAAIEGLVGSTEAMRRARKLAGEQAQLGRLVDRWAPLAMARQLLTLSMERFERDNQPALLQGAARLFRSLTNGRYVNVRRRLDENQSLAVETEQGDLKTPNQLSTGAREQLYLAIRLAYVAQYCERSEPLPMVMDDILVNFDDQRAASALQVLHEFAADRQILFLTCHQRTLELAAPLNIDVTELQLHQPPPAKRRRKSSLSMTLRVDSPSTPERASNAPSDDVAPPVAEQIVQPVAEGSWETDSIDLASSTEEPSLPPPAAKDEADESFADEGTRSAGTKRPDASKSDAKNRDSKNRDSSKSEASNSGAAEVQRVLFPRQ